MLARISKVLVPGKPKTVVIGWMASQPLTHYYHKAAPANLPPARLLPTLVRHCIVEKCRVVVRPLKKFFLAIVFLATGAAGVDARISNTSNSRYYKVDEFAWQSGHRLSWDDFRGPVPNGRDIVAAETSCGIGFETNVITRGVPVQFRVYNTFSTSRSWVRADARTPEVLEHEQGHFDLCELYTRKLRQRFAATEGITANNLRMVTRAVWKEVHDAYRDRQDQYEDETDHGLNRDAQVTWTAYLEKELAATEGWASN